MRPDQRLGVMMQKPVAICDPWPRSLDLMFSASNLSRLHALVDLVEGRDAFVLDIGANAGVYAVTLGAAAAPGSRVIAFEPNPIMIGRLGYNVRLNDLQDRIRIESCALGLQRGEATLSFVRNNYGEATLLPVASRQRRGGTLVPVRALGEFAHEAEGHDLSVIKIDVEGAEPQVLAPMLRAPNGWLPDAILIETEHAAVWEMDLVAMISDKGYEIALQAEGNTFFVRHGVA
ncbi:MAG: FkbM family methyltransferase [Pseudomonadota bacterium]